MFYGAAYYPEHWPRDRWETDARLMREAGINTVRMAESAWALLEPQENEYRWDWLDEAIELLARHGIKTVLATPTATPPPWLCIAYPEILRVDRQGRPVGDESRQMDHCAASAIPHPYCAGSETYRQFTERIVTAMGERYGGHPQVIGWQIDNELGCHDSTHCYCPDCRIRFQHWVRDRYGDLATLNDRWSGAAWGQRFPSWKQIPLPVDTVGGPDPCLELDFWRFSSDQIVAYQELQVDILRQLCPGQTITTNLPGASVQEIDCFSLAEPLDLISWDNYPLGEEPLPPADVALTHTAMRGLKDRPFWVMEQQAGPCGWGTMGRTPKPGHLRLWTYQAIAHGADGVVYSRWRTRPFGAEQYWHGVLDHDGVPRRRYDEIRQVGRELQGIGDRLPGASPPRAIALLISYDNSFALQFQPGIEGFDYQELLQNYYRAFHDLKLAVDIVSPNADLAAYPVVIAPTLYLLLPEWEEGLRHYVEQGGHLVVGVRSGSKDESNRAVTEPLPGRLRALCGIDVVEYDALGREHDNAVRFESGIPQLGNTVCAAHLWCDILRPFDAEVLARYTEDYYAGEPAITTRRAGKGRVTYVGTIGNDGLYGGLARWLAHEADLVPLAKAPAGVEVTAREREGVTYLFVLNHTAQEQAVQVPYSCVDLVSGANKQDWEILPPCSAWVLAPAGGCGSNRARTG